MVSSAERNTNLPFDRAECLRYAVASYDPPVWGVPARNDYGFLIEPRYLADEYRVGERRAAQLTSVSERVAATVGGWEDASVALTPDLRNQWRQEEAQQEGQFGHTMLAAGRAHGAVAPLTTTEAIASFGVGEDELIPPHGWDVFRHGKSGGPVLLVPAEDAGQFEMVALDALYIRDPEAVREPLRALHTARALAHLAHRVEHEVLLHTAVTPDVTPPYLRALSEMTDADTRARQVVQAIDTVRFMDWTGTNAWIINPQVAYRMKRALGGSVQGAHGQPLYIEDSLSHMAECSAEPPASQAKNRMLHGIYYSLQRTDFSSPEAPEVADTERDLLLHPGQYTLWPARHAQAAERHAAERLRDDRFMQFGMRAVGMRDTRHVLAAMQKRLPQTHAAVVALRTAMGEESYGGHSSFDEMLRSAARPIIGPSIPEEGLSLYGLRSRIAEELAQRTRWRDINIEGVELRTRTPHFHNNQHLEFALPLLVMKTAITGLAADMRRAASNMTHERLANQRERWEALLRNLPTEYQQRLRRADEADRQTGEHAAQLVAVQRARGITDAELTVLQEELAPTEYRWESDEPPYSYTFMFNALYLSKRGVVDFSSDFHRAIFALLPYNPNQAEAVGRAWQRLAALAQST